MVVCLFVCLLAFESYVIGDLDFLNPMGAFNVFLWANNNNIHHTARNVQKKGLNCSSQKWQNPKCGKFYTIGCVMSICHQALITPGNGLSTSRVHTCCSLLYGVKFSS